MVTLLVAKTVVTTTQAQLLRFRISLVDNKATANIHQAANLNRPIKAARTRLIRTKAMTIRRKALMEGNITM